MVRFGISSSVATLLVALLKSQKEVSWMVRMTTYEASHPSECFLSALLVKVTQPKAPVASKDSHVVVITKISVKRVARRLHRNTEN
jgi:hypothetical protein